MTQYSKMNDMQLQLKVQISPEISSLNINIRDRNNNNNNLLNAATTNQHRDHKYTIKTNYVLHMKTKNLNMQIFYYGCIQMGSIQICRNSRTTIYE